MARASRHGLIGDTPAEKRAARQYAREVCSAERQKLKHWIPTERARVAAAVAKVKADARVEIARIRAQFTRDVRTKREETSARTCVDRIAGPTVRRFGPRPPPGHKPKRAAKGASGKGFADRMAKARAAKKKGGARPKARRPRRK